MTLGWEAFVATHFAGFLLPSAGATELSPGAAEDIMGALMGHPAKQELLVCVPLLAPGVPTLRDYLREAVTPLLARLPSATQTERRTWQGGFHGRIAVKETQSLHVAGKVTDFVTASRRRTFDLPENVLLRSVCERLLSLLVKLREAKVLPAKGWGEALRACEGTLLWQLNATALAHVKSRPVGVADEIAALAAREEAYHQTALWACRLREVLDEANPERIAQVVARGALLPLDEPSRFELAVLIRLAQALKAKVCQNFPGRWTPEQALVLPRRSDVFCLRRDDGLQVRLFYNQSELPEGPADLGGKHYLENVGRLPLYHGDSDSGRGAFERRGHRMQAV